MTSVIVAQLDKCVPESKKIELYFDRLHIIKSKWIQNPLNIFGFRV